MIKIFTNEIFATSSSSSEDGEDGSEEILHVTRSLQSPSGMLLTPFLFFVIVLDKLFVYGRQLIVEWCLLLLKFRSNS